MPYSSRFWQPIFSSGQRAEYTTRLSSRCLTTRLTGKRRLAGNTVRSITWWPRSRKRGTRFTQDVLRVPLVRPCSKGHKTWTTECNWLHWTFLSLSFSREDTLNVRSLSWFCWEICVGLLQTNHSNWIEYIEASTLHYSISNGQIE